MNHIIVGMVPCMMRSRSPCHTTDSVREKYKMSSKPWIPSEFEDKSGAAMCRQSCEDR